MWMRWFKGKPVNTQIQPTIHQREARNKLGSPEAAYTVTKKIIYLGA